MSKLRYLAPKGQRVKRYGLKVFVTGMFWCPITRKWYDWYNSWLEGEKIYTEYRKHREQCICHTFPLNKMNYPKTVRAFKRMLRKYPEIKGKAVWVNEYMNKNGYYDVHG